MTHDIRSWMTLCEAKDELPARIAKLLGKMIPVTLKDGRQGLLTVERGQRAGLHVSVKVDGEYIGTLYIEPNNVPSDDLYADDRGSWSVSNVSVDPAFHRQGIATAMYDVLARGGLKILRSGNYGGRLLPDGNRLWQYAGRDLERYRYHHPSESRLMATPSLVQSVFARGNGASQAVTLGSTPTVGNLLVAICVGHSGTGGTMDAETVAPSGWGLVHVELTSPNQGGWIWTRRVQSGDGTTYTFTQNADWHNYGLFEVADCVAVQADHGELPANTTTLTTPAFPALPTDSIRLLGFTTDQTATYTAPAGYTLLSPTTWQNVANHDGAIWQLPSTAVASGTITLSASSSSQLPIWIEARLLGTVPATIGTLPVIVQTASAGPVTTTPSNVTFASPPTSGNILLAIAIGWAFTTNNVVPPSGWTLRTNAAPSNNQGVSVYTKTSNGTETTTAWASIADRIRVLIFELSGVISLGFNNGNYSHNDRYVLTNSRPGASSRLSILAAEWDGTLQVNGIPFDWTRLSPAGWTGGGDGNHDGWIGIIPSFYSGQTGLALSANNANNIWQTVDLPGNGSPAIWNDNDKAFGSTRAGGLIYTGTGGVCGIRSDASQASGKYYFEFTLPAVGFECLVGVANATRGLTNNSSSNAAVLRRTTGEISVNLGATLATLSGITAGCVIGVAVDLDAHTISFRVAPSGTWAGPFSIAALGLPLYAVAATVNSDTVTANFGTSAFVGAAPAGFYPGFPWGTVSMSVPSTSQAMAVVMA